MFECIFGMKEFLCLAFILLQLFAPALKCNQVLIQLNLIEIMNVFTRLLKSCRQGI